MRVFTFGLHGAEARPAHDGAHRLLNCGAVMVPRTPYFTGLFLAAILFCPQTTRAGVTEQTFNVPLGQYFVLDQHGGPAVRMRVRNVDISFVDMNYTDEYSRPWNVHTEKHNSVQGREANLTLLYRHAATGFEVYFLNAMATPNGQAAIVTRKPQ